MSVKVSGLTKIYGTQKAVNDISFEVNKGEVLGFLGPNGAGKSTTMKILTCFVPQTSGTATVCGFDTTSAPMEVTKKIGYLPESNPLYYDMYVREYLEFVANVYELKEIKSKTESIIETVGLSREANKKIGQLSKGYKQRVGLAAALIHDPEVLILDEPTSGLDPNQIIEIREVIRKLGQNKTVLFSSHILQEVEALCDRVVIINKGKLVANDTLHVLRSQSRNQQLVKVTFKETVDPSLLRGLAGVQA